MLRSVVFVLGATLSANAYAIEKLSCIGTEPFWSLEFTDTQVSYNAPGEKTTQIPNPKYSSSTGTSIEYLIVASAMSDKISLRGFVQRVDGLNVADVQGNPPIGGAKYNAYCSDGMSNKLYPYIIHMFINNHPYTGCCHSRSYPAIGEP